MSALPFSHIPDLNEAGGAPLRFHVTFMTFVSFASLAAPPSLCFSPGP